MAPVTDSKDWIVSIAVVVALLNALFTCLYVNATQKTLRYKGAELQLAGFMPQAGTGADGKPVALYVPAYAEIKR